MHPSLLFDQFTQLYRPYIKLMQPLLDQYQLHPAQWLVMKDIAISPGTTLVQISKRRSIEKPTTRKVLKALDAQGWLTVCPGEIDKREKLLYLSPSGQDIHKQLSRQISQLQTEMLETLSMSKDELNQLADQLENIYQTIRHHLQTETS
ncbi:MarR family winged helix-turn-helix transcriptional regulator [Staphylococcus lutrae]|uniref:MarR family transcriptional regulator n=1 Tax=Staphylococcus lutrae TaxID=155085 RepID=A0AAC9RRP1_9STAP|nr:MarR family transcriptional regulator [Staphylococcus lutrae]ARJ50419.1 MarR family transcriptional regulator [Staphylococcus lutrae]PNZ38765.1 MarR family transcriptional regulator [Staphylococcus lutrae]